MKSACSIAVIIFILITGSSYADSAAKSNNKGMESYKNNKHEESVRHFTDALLERPNSPALRYNLGTALSALGKMQEAGNELSIAARSSNDKQLSSSAHFNAGNVLYYSQNYEGAIDEYKQALKLDQNSQDIRHNLELAVRQLQNQQDQQKKDEENKDGEKKDENNEDKQDKQDNENKEENKENQNDEQENKTKNSEEKDPQDQQQQQSNQQNSENQPMTPEEAQRILDAINDEEKKALSLRRMEMKTEMKQGDDW